MPNNPMKTFLAIAVFSISAVAQTLSDGANLNTIIERSANKGQPNGYAGLDGTGKVLPARLPDAGQLAGLPLTGSGTLCFDAATKLFSFGCLTQTVSYVLGGWSSQYNNSADSTRGVFATGTDGTNFSLVSTALGITGTYGYLRDTTVVRTSNGTWGAAGTCDNSNPATPGVCLFVASSLAGLYNSTYTQIQPSNSNNDVNANNNYSWAPEFFTDNEGCTSGSGNDVWGIPCTGPEAYYLFYSASNNADGGRILAIKFTDASLTSWTNIAGTPGVASVVFSAYHIYDPSVTTFYNPGTGQKTYAMFHVSNNGGSSEINIQYLTSTSLAGPFTPASTGDWSHRFNNHDAGPTAQGNTYEGPNFVRTGATSARLYFDYIGSVSVQSQGVYYIEATNIDFTNPASLSTATWAPNVKLPGPGTPGTLGDHWRHLTVKRLVNVTIPPAPAPTNVPPVVSAIINEGTGLTAANSADSSNNLTGNSGLSWGTVSGLTGPVAILDGNHYLKAVSATPTSFLANQAFSGCVRFNVSSFTGGTELIMGNADGGDGARGWQLFLGGGSGSNIVIGISDNAGHQALVLGPTVSLNTWYDGCFTYDGSGRAGGIGLYLNGNLVSSNNLVDNLLTGGPPTSTLPVYVGALGNSTNGSFGLGFRGALADVRLVRKALNGAEIAAINSNPRQ